MLVSLMRNRPRPFVVLALYMAACDPEGCDNTTPTPTGGFQVSIDAGDGQTQVADLELDQPIVVRVLNDVASGDPIPISSATFEVETGGGQIRADGNSSYQSKVTKSTPAAGANFVSVLWKLGPQPGLNNNTVKVTFNNGSKPNFLRFTASARGPAAQVVIETGDGQNGEANAELAVRPSVKVTDANGIQVPGMRVWFIPQDGGAPVDGEVITTSQFGVATMTSRWRLGGGVGTQHLIARVLEGTTGSVDAQIANNPLTFTANATAAAPHNVARYPAGFPEPQNGFAGQPVAQKPTVQVTDGGGFPLAGISVRFEIASGGGSFGGSSILFESVTNGTGVLGVANWILGIPGTNTVTATVMAGGAPAPGVIGNPVTFTANATEPPTTLTLSKTAGDNQSGTVNFVLAINPQVRVTDAQGNGVQGIAISWTVTQGSGTFTFGSPTTDANGYAALDYFAPTAAGQVRLRATTTDSRVAPQFVEFTFTVGL